MADISQYLANILSAVYGEDVRGSIHDAIEIINDVGEAVLTTGSGAPSGTTFENSLYIDTTNWIVYKYTSGAWASQGTIRGTDGVGITSITKTATAGLIDTYTILYTDGSSTTFDVTNGADGDDGNKWYRGTAISGKAVNPTVYSGSGITLANPNDFYLNITEGAIYYCVSGGDASTATWSYDFTMSGGGSNPEWVDVQNKPFSSIGSTLKVATDTLDVDQDNLSYDASPTSASTKLVNSGGIYTALQNVSGTVSDAWDSGTTYAVGDYCIYNNTLWKCLTANTATTPTEGSDWTAKTVGEELGSLNSDLSELNQSEGTFTLTYSGGNYTGGINNQNNRYFKIGKLVLCKFNFKMAASSSSGAEYATYTGLPFVSKYSGIIGIMRINNSAKMLSGCLTATSNSNYVNIYFIASDGSYVSSGQDIEGTLIYYT